MKSATPSPIKAYLLSLAFLSALLCVKAEDVHPIQTIPLDGVEGRIDHMAFDPAGKRLFICALGNNTVEVVDLTQSKVVRSLSGFSEPQGVCFVPEFNLLAVANGGDGRVAFFNGKDFSPLDSLSLGDDADNVRYDTAHKTIVVGYGSGALAVIDPATRKVVSTIPLSSHPESFQIDTSGARIYVNVPNAHTVSVIDVAQKKVTGSYSLGLVAANFPMALDESNHRLFVGCRIPARLLVFDTTTGNKVATLNLHGDCDDVFYDASKRQIYASCGEGYLDIFAQSDADHYSLKQAVPTASGARTSFFDGEKVYVVVPHRGNQPAELRIYQWKG
jgi:YVTN family beta-propeller protein